MYRRLTLSVAVLLVGGSATPGDVPVYDYRAGGNFYNYAGPSFPIEDQLLAPLSNGKSYGAFLTQAKVGVANLASNVHVTDVLLVWYDTIDFDAGPGEQFISDGAGSVLFGDVEIPAGGVVEVTMDLGGSRYGIPVTNQYFAVEPSLWTPGLVIPDLGATMRCSSDGTLGWSGDYFFGDVDLDGTLEAGERFDFGGDPFAANLYMAYRACIPCDANCDGTINAFDIQPFVAALTGAVGCSDCAADANLDGSVNPFDIQGFVDCLSKPLEMR